MAGRPKTRAKRAGLYGKSDTLFTYRKGPNDVATGVVCSTRGYTPSTLGTKPWMERGGGQVPESALEEHFRRMPSAIAEGGRVHSTHHRHRRGDRYEILTWCKAGKLVTYVEWDYQD